MSSGHRFDRLIDGLANVSSTAAVVSVVEALFGGCAPSVVDEDVDAAVFRALHREVRLEATLRCAVALYFVLGRRLEIHLSEATQSMLLSCCENWAGQKKFDRLKLLQLAQLIVGMCHPAIGSGGQRSSATVLGTHTHTDVVAFLDKLAPERQRLVIPLYLRVLLSAHADGAWMKNLVLNHTGHVHHCVRVVAALPGMELTTLQELTEVQLTHADVAGERSRLRGTSRSIDLLGKKVMDDGAMFTVLHHNPYPTSQQINHPYVLATIRAEWTRRRVQGLPGLPKDTCTVLVEYITTVLANAAQYLTTATRQLVFSSGKQIGLVTIEAALCEAVSLADLVVDAHVRFRSQLTTAVKELLNLGFTLCRTSRNRTPHDAVPELIDNEIASNVQNYESENGKAACPHLHHDVVLQCYIFMLHHGSPRHVLPLLNKIFQPRIWAQYCSQPTFATQFMLMLLDNMEAHCLLPEIAPRLLTLVAIQPTRLTAILTQLMRHMVRHHTATDIFLRIMYLPCITYFFESQRGGFHDDDTSPACAFLREFEVAVFTTSDEIAKERDVGSSSPAPEGRTVNEGEEEEAFAPPPAGAVATSALESFSMEHRFSFEEWHELHKYLGDFSPRMMISFRVMRSLLDEFFKCPHLHESVFPAIVSSCFFFPSPEDARRPISDLLMEKGRWLAEMNPEWVVRYMGDLRNAMRQKFIPEERRMWDIQQWASVTAARAAAACPTTPRQVIHQIFEAAYDLVWEHLALISAEMTEMADTSYDSGVLRSAGDALPPLDEFLTFSTTASCGQQSSLSLPPGGSNMGAGAVASSARSHMMPPAYHGAPSEPSFPADGDSDPSSLRLNDSTADLTNSLATPTRYGYVDPAQSLRSAQKTPGTATSSTMFTPVGKAIVSDYVETTQTGTPASTGVAGVGASTVRGAGEPSYTAGSTKAWAARPYRKDLKGVGITQFLHGLVISITLLGQRCSDLRERCRVCLANVVRTLSRADKAGITVAQTAAMCIKLVGYPPMGTGAQSLPVNALLSLNYADPAAPATFLCDLEGDPTPMSPKSMAAQSF